MATVRMTVTMSDSAMSRYLRIYRGASAKSSKGKLGLPMDAFAAKCKVSQNQGLGGSDK